MATAQKITVEVILKYDEFEQLFNEWLAEQPVDDVIPDVLHSFLDWLKKRVINAGKNLSE